jgi:hypothetical protein
VDKSLNFEILGQKAVLPATLRLGQEEQKATLGGEDVASRFRIEDFVTCWHRDDSG